MFDGCRSTFSDSAIRSWGESNAGSWGESTGSWDRTGKEQSDLGEQELFDPSNETGKHNKQFKKPDIEFRIWIHRRMRRFVKPVRDILAFEQIQRKVTFQNIYVNSLLGRAFNPSWKQSIDGETRYIEMYTFGRWRSVEIYNFYIQSEQIRYYIRISEPRNDPRIVEYTGQTRIVWNRRKRILLS